MSSAAREFYAAPSTKRDPAPKPRLHDGRKRSRFERDLASVKRALGWGISRQTIVETLMRFRHGKPDCRSYAVQTVARAALMLAQEMSSQNPAEVNYE
jgi:hypothetical protein